MFQVVIDVLTPTEPEVDALVGSEVDFLGEFSQTVDLVNVDFFQFVAVHAENFDHILRREKLGLDDLELVVGQSKVCEHFERAEEILGQRFDPVRGQIQTLQLRDRVERVAIDRPQIVVEHLDGAERAETDEALVVQCGELRAEDEHSLEARERQVQAARHKLHDLVVDDQNSHLVGNFLLEPGQRVVNFEVLGVANRRLVGEPALKLTKAEAVLDLTRFSRLGWLTWKTLDEAFVVLEAQRLVLGVFDVIQKVKRDASDLIVVEVQTCQLIEPSEGSERDRFDRVERQVESCEVLEGLEAVGRDVLDEVSGEVQAFEFTQSLEVIFADPRE